MLQSRGYEPALATAYADDDSSKRNDADAVPACWSRGKEVSLPHNTSCMNSVSCKKPAWKMNISGEGGKAKPGTNIAEEAKQKKKTGCKEHMNTDYTVDYRDRLVTRKKRGGGQQPTCLLCRNNMHMHIQLCSMSASDSFFIRMWRRAGWDSLFKTAKEKRKEGKCEKKSE